MPRSARFRRWCARFRVCETGPRLPVYPVKPLSHRPDTDSITNSRIFCADRCFCRPTQSCFRAVNEQKVKAQYCNLHLGVGPKPYRNSLMPGKVWIAAMNMRGVRVRAEAVDPTSIRVNVTSAQAKLNKHRLAFSPMTPIQGGYKGYWNFESYWQSGKKFKGVPIERSRAWWRAQKVPRRRYPGAKTRVVEHAEFEGHPGPLGYVESRKRVYVPEYAALIEQRAELKGLARAPSIGGRGR
jgi:hypothetical protein